MPGSHPDNTGMFFRGIKQRLETAKAEFHRDRAALEEEFFATAAASGRPRGLRWIQCDFHGEPAFARDPSTGRLQALVVVEIGFEAIEGGGMEEVEAVGNIRAATAVFRREDDRWTTDGRTVFNLDPEQTILHFRLEPLDAGTL
jgi:hypothetical protein